MEELKEDLNVLEFRKEYEKSIKINVSTCDDLCYCWMFIKQ